MWVKPEHSKHILLQEPQEQPPLRLCSCIYLVWGSSHIKEEIVTNWQRSCVPQDNFCSKEYVSRDLNINFNLDTWVGAENPEVWMHIGMHTYLKCL